MSQVQFVRSFCEGVSQSEEKQRQNKVLTVNMAREVSEDSEPEDDKSLTMEPVNSHQTLTQTGSSPSQGKTEPADHSGHQ